MTILLIVFNGICIKINDLETQSVSFTGIDWFMSWIPSSHAPAPSLQLLQCISGKKVGRTQFTSAWNLNSSLDYNQILAPQSLLSQIQLALVESADFPHGNKTVHLMQCSHGCWVSLHCVPHLLNAENRVQPAGLEELFYWIIHFSEMSGMSPRPSSWPSTWDIYQI